MYSDSNMDRHIRKKKGVSLLDTPIAGGSEGEPRRISMSVSDRRGTFFGDRRVSVAESARRTSWLEKSRQTSLQMKNRAKLLFEQHFSDAFQGLYSVCISPDGESMAAGFGSGAIQVRNPDNGEVKATLRAGMDQSYPIMCIRYHPIKQDIFYASSADGFIYLCSAAQYDFSKYAEERKNEINTIDISINGEILASGGRDAAIRLYDVETSKMTTVYRKKEGDFQTEDAMKFHRAKVFALRFHPNMRETFLTGGWDNTVKVWDIRVHDGCVRNIKGPHICGDAIDMKENVVVTGSWVVASSLQLWDINTTKLIETIWPANRPSNMEGEFLYAVKYFDGDPYGGTLCVGGSGTGFLEVINLKDRRIVGSLKVGKPIYCIDTHGNLIVFGGIDPFIRVGEFA